MNKFKKTSGLSALVFLLLSFVITPAIAGQSASGIAKAQFCDVVMAAEEKGKEKGKGKDGKAEEEPDCE